MDNLLVMRKPLKKSPTLITKPQLGAKPRKLSSRPNQLEHSRRTTKLPRSSTSGFDTSVNIFDVDESTNISFVKLYDKVCLQNRRKPNASRFTNLDFNYDYLGASPMGDVLQRKASLVTLSNESIVTVYDVSPGRVYQPPLWTRSPNSTKVKTQVMFEIDYANSI